MITLAPLVFRLTAFSLVALALADGGPGSHSLDVAKLPKRTTVMPIRNSGPGNEKRKQERRRKLRRTTTTKTTTTSTTPMYDDDEEHTTPIITTTVDPRSFDHTEMGSCEVPLGMESGMISNESLAASSSYDQSVSPLSSRIRTEIRGGAWCPNGLISTRSRQFLELDLNAEYMITATESQGRFANSIGVEFVESYAVEYWREALKRWVKYKDFNGNRQLPGNVNTYTPRKTSLEAPFIASKVRFYPYASHPRTACMRVEIYGCRWKQALIAYSAPKGGDMQSMTGGAVFEDLSYDGVMRNGRLIDGLGQLTDSFTGPNDFELPDPMDTQGTRWVGWNKTISVDDEVKLTFNFSDNRLFQYVDIHTNNMFTKDVQLFKEAEVYFSLEGERWQEDYISNEPKQDRVSEHARIIHINLENRTAKHIMFKLKFQHEWILLSEITFTSVPTVVNSSAEFLEEYYRTDDSPSSRKKRDSSFTIPIGWTCAVVAGGLVLTALIVVLIVKRTRQMIINFFQRPFCPMLRNTNARNNRRAPRLALALANCPPIHMLRPTVVDEDYREPYNIWRETMGHREKMNMHDQNEYNEICEDPEYPRPYMMKRPDPHETFYAATDIIHHYPDERTYRRDRPPPGLFTSIKLPEAEPPIGVAPLLDFPRGRMRPVTFLGEGPHGTVFLPRYTLSQERLLTFKQNLSIIPENDNDIPLNIPSLNDELSDLLRVQLSRSLNTLILSKIFLKICKSVKRKAIFHARAAFAREATWGAGLKHPQLARVLGLSLLEPPCAALDRGDALPLPTILKMERRLSYASLIRVCCQIASGMKYLESFELVHRDLAARNVTVSDGLRIKVADYAMFCEEFIGDYHLMADGSRIPLRWMAWESLLMGIYSPASDVWSFGVTVWEVLTYCLAKPFEEMNDDQVVTNASDWRYGARGARVPAAPLPRCRRELYDLMHECWRREPNQRPRFHDLHRFLDRMTHGHKPPTHR